ncbi:MAG: DJ-1/PfpI family protein, partial [Bacteroidales bacterium]|nr:DJ-1/PfpI family protein [Bacteroidales bacterium]
IEFVRKVVNEGKPIAAQTGAVLILAKAGVLNGKKFAFPKNEIDNPDMYPEFKSGIYSGNGVVQDGNIITSGICPMMAKMNFGKDGTAELTQKLIQEIKTRT